MTAKLDGTNGLLQQYDYQVPTTGFSYTFAAGTTVLVMNPAGTLATGTITMPSAPADGMTISFSSTQVITTLTVAGNTGQSIVGNPITLNAGGAATLVYRLSNTTWYTQVNTAVSSTGVPVLNVYTSPGTWSKPATVKAIKVTVIGGGGDGGAVGPGPAYGSGGGGGGAAIRVYPAPSIPGSQPYTVGGPGASSSFGVSPAPSPFAVITATAGSAGSAGSAANGTIYYGGSGGSGSGGQANMVGGGGTTSLFYSFTGPVLIRGAGTGGSTILGGGASSAGSAGGAYGGGGAGSSTATGGSGATGVVIVEEFY
jgi:hypothetical protein